MKIAANRNCHLTDCTHIHAAETGSQVFENLQRYLLPLKAQLAPEVSFGSCLHLSNLAAQQLLQDDGRSQFQSWQQHLYVFILNASGAFIFMITDC